MKLSEIIALVAILADSDRNEEYLDDRLKKIEDKIMAGIQEVKEALTSQIENLNTKIESLQTAVSGVATSLTSEGSEIKSVVEGLKSKLEEATNVDLSSEIASLTSLSDRLDGLRTQLTQVEADIPNLVSVESAPLPEVPPAATPEVPPTQEVPPVVVFPEAPPTI